MTTLSDIAPGFVEIAHRIVWATVATVDSAGRPRTRILHPYWEWENGSLTGYFTTWKTPIKLAHLKQSPYMSVGYRAEGYGDAAIAECRAAFTDDDEVKKKVWEFFASTPEPLGFDPGALGIPGWDGPTSPGFSVVVLRPWRLMALSKDTLMTKGPTGAPTWVES